MVTAGAVFNLVQLVYHGNSHSIFHMSTTCFTCYLQPFADTQLADTSYNTLQLAAGHIFLLVRRSEMQHVDYLTLHSTTRLHLHVSDGCCQYAVFLSPI